MFEDTSDLRLVDHRWVSDEFYNVSNVYDMRLYRQNKQM
jgi:hypothetical protein